MGSWKDRWIQNLSLGPHVSWPMKVHILYYPCHHLAALLTSNQFTVSYGFQASTLFMGVSPYIA